MVENFACLCICGSVIAALLAAVGYFADKDAKLAGIDLSADD